MTNSKPCIFAPERNKLNQKTSRSDYWAQRREWWRAEAKRCGCDWAGINRSQIEVADYLASLRRRKA